MEKGIKGIVFRCTHCEATLKAPQNSIGNQGLCPNCQNKVVVPEKSVIYTGKEESIKNK